MTTYEWRSKLYIDHIRIYLIFFHWKSTRGENWKNWCGYVWRENSCLYILKGTIIWLIFPLLTANNRPAFQWIVDKYGGRIYIYLLQLCIWFFFPLTDMTSDKNHRCHQKYRFFLFHWVQIHISQIYTLWTKIQGYHLTQLVWNTWIIFHLL